MKDDLERDLDLLALAEGGESLSPERRAQLEAAIQESPELAAQYEATRLVVQYVDHIPLSESSPSFVRGLESKLDAVDERRTRSTWHRWFTVDPMSWRFVGGAGLAAAAAVLAAILWLPPSTVNPGLDSRATAQLELLDVAENLELLEDLDIAEHLDVLDDLDVIAALDEEESG